MALWHGLALAGALMALLCLPSVVVLLANADQIAVRRAWRRDATTLELLRRLEVRLRTRQAVPAPVEVADPPCVEQIAAELRRLNRLRRSGPATQSDAWLAAVTDAYDRWLGVACQTLGIGEELQRLDGLDRELERARIEEVLRDKGF